MKSLIGRRVEQLESRCLLSVASFSDHLIADWRESFVTERIAGGGLTEELQLPQPELPLLEVPPIQPPYIPDAEPARGDLDSFVPPDDNEKESAPDGGGQIDLGGYGDSGGAAGGDSGGTTPADVRGERESRAVLQMLAGLKYPVQDLAANKADASTSEVEFADPTSAATRTSSVRLDERTIDIAVSELADEFTDAPAQVRSAGESLLDVEVQMDRAAGRYQAFEVLTTDPAAARTESLDARSEFHTVPMSNSGEVSQHSESLKIPEQPSAATSLPTNLTTEATTVEATSPLTILYTLVDEKFGTTWTRAISLVLFGLVVHLVRPHFQSSLPDDPDETKNEVADDSQRPRRKSRGWPNNAELFRGRNYS